MPWCFVNYSTNYFCLSNKHGSSIIVYSILLVYWIAENNFKTSDLIKRPHLFQWFQSWWNIRIQNWSWNHMTICRNIFLANLTHWFFFQITYIVLGNNVVFVNVYLLSLRMLCCFLGALVGISLTKTPSVAKGNLGWIVANSLSIPANLRKITYWLC